jgi:hypothetical protein
MELKFLVSARKKAESAVADMSDTTLKVAAFQTILSRLLEVAREQDLPRESTGTALPTATRRRGPGDFLPAGTSSRILSLAEDGFFREQRSLAEIQTGLAERGWHYDQNNLSTPLARLVRRKVLRRTQVADGSKKLWRYSIY